jgi:hypothetical protein
LNSGGSEKTSALAEARAEVARLTAQVEGLTAAVPATWLDPLLSGDEKVLPGQGPWGCPDIERLLNAIRERLRKLAAQREGPR